jgi:ribosomal protein L37E
MDFPIVRKAYQRIFNKMKTMIDNKEIVSITKFSIRFADGKELKVTEFRDEFFAKMFEDLKFIKKTTTLQKEIVAYVIRSIKGYWRRNGQYLPTTKKKTIKEINSPKCSFKGRAINYSETSGYVDDKLRITTRLGSVKLEIHKIISKYKLEKMQRVGGNLVLKIKKNKPIIMFVGYVDHLEDVAYEPEGFLGFDVNKDPKYFLTFSNGTIIERKDYLSDLMKIKDTLNTIIKPKKVSKEIYDKYRATPVSIQEIAQGMELIESYNPVWARYIKDKISKGDDKYFVIRTKQRRNIRNYRERMSKAINKEMRKMAMQLINDAVENNFGLGIDNITTGAKMGEYGQGFSRILIEQCRMRRIPYYTIPSPNTTKICSQCGHKDDNNREGDKFNCASCGYQTVTHKNSALNIANMAKEFYDAGCLYGVQEGRSVKAAITRNFEIQSKFNKEMAESNA